VVLDATPPDALRARAEAAVRYCPTHALSIVDEADPNEPRGD
jgi:sterol 14-demethylase